MKTHIWRLEERPILYDVIIVWWTGEGERGEVLLTKATNHGCLDKSCHWTTITQSENDSTTSTHVHKSNACV